jgi:hypothetical protein
MNKGIHHFTDFRGDTLLYYGPHWSQWDNLESGTLPEGCFLIKKYKKE